VSANTPGYWHTDAASEDMRILLEERFIRRVTAVAGADHEESRILFRRARTC